MNPEKGLRLSDLSFKICMLPSSWNKIPLVLLSFTDNWIEGSENSPLIWKEYICWKQDFILPNSILCFSLFGNLKSLGVLVDFSNFKRTVKCVFWFTLYVGFLYVDFVAYFVFMSIFRYLWLYLIFEDSFCFSIFISASLQNNSILLLRCLTYLEIGFSWLYNVSVSLAEVLIENELTRCKSLCV